MRLEKVHFFYCVIFLKKYLIIYFIIVYDIIFYQIRLYHMFTYHIIFYYIKYCVIFTFESHLHVLFDVPTAISSNCKDLLHPQESFSRVFLRSNSHFKPLQGFSSPSRVIFMCFSTSQQPFQATSRIFFSHLQCTICPQVPPKGFPVPPKCPFVPGFTLKG